MASFPPEPISPREFMEEVVPAFYADAELDAADREVELWLGVVLRGAEGGDWTLHFDHGQLEIESGREERCEITFVLGVDDWRAALWEGRPGLIADAVRDLAAGNDGPTGGTGRPAGNPTVLRGLTDLQGLVELTIAGGEDDEGGDWRVGVQLGPGPIPETPQATMHLGAEQAEAIRRGALHPVEALITGQLRLEGDLGLILQLQAVAMTLSMAAPGLKG